VTSADITGLSSGSKYHYNVVAVSAGGTTVGSDVTFTTAYPPPTATTLGASGVNAGSVTLQASVNAGGTATACFFQYGVTTNYGLISASKDIGDGRNIQSVSILVSNLVSSTTYYYSAAAVSSGGTTFATNYGSFATQAIIPPSLSSAIASSVTDGRNHMNLNLGNVPGATFSVYCSPSLNAPMSAWQAIGTMTEVSPGQYQFTDPSPATNPVCFYSIQSN
jgi:hypothetical protein